MSEFKPEVGLVIRHAYLWWNEARKGREEGAKDRPCVIVHLRQNEYQETETFIAPITHTPPAIPEKAIEIPQSTKKRLGRQHCSRETNNRARCGPTGCDAAVHPNR